MPVAVGATLRTTARLIFLASAKGHAGGCHPLSPPPFQLTDSTHTDYHRSATRLLRRAAISIVILTLAAGWGAGLAAGDGDPASDVLATQALFLPQDAGIPADQQAQLRALLAEAGLSRYRIRVALIASPADLGSITALWRQPQSYAEFLGEELSLIYRGPLLVAMPNGYGLYRATGKIPAETTALGQSGAPGGELGAATLTAIQRLAAATGHTLAIPNATAPSSRSSTDTLPWIVFAIGTALIAIAWTGSLRAQPLQIRRHKPRSP
jgi:hypothetical protein